jgi:hypothetical protein
MREAALDISQMIGTLPAQPYARRRVSSSRVCFDQFGVAQRIDAKYREHGTANRFDG